VQPIPLQCQGGRALTARGYANRLQRIHRQQHQRKEYTMTTPSNPLIDRVRIGNIQASIWRNLDANNNAYYSIRVDRHYKDRNGKWDVTSSYRMDDLPVLGKVSDLACERVCELQEMDRGSVSSYQQDAA
jgi:hypothetical protein